MAITLKQKHRIQTSGKNNQVNTTTITYSDFINLHPNFIQEKSLENLSSRTINDHKMFFGYFTNWLNESNWFDVNQGIQKSVFLDYKEYMLFDKKYASCTINLRLRTLKLTPTGF